MVLCGMTPNEVCKVLKKFEHMMFFVRELKIMSHPSG